MKKLGQISDILTGLVVKRKQADQFEVDFSAYKLLTLKSLDQDGYLNSHRLEDFDSTEILDPKYLTKLNDVVIRLSSPYTAILIREGEAGHIISSLFITIRNLDKRVLPEYLSILLNNEKIKQYLIKCSVGSKIQIVNTSSIKNIDIEIPNLEQQKKIIEITILIKKEKRLFAELLKTKAKFNNELVNKLLGGELK